MSGIRNARILETFLGFEDHGIFTAILTFDYGGAQQSMPGFGLRDENGIGWGAEYLARLLEKVGVDSWERLKGLHVRVDIQGGVAVRVGHILKDQWFDPKALHREVYGK